jgi:hypothetical protein
MWTIEQKKKELSFLMVYGDKCLLVELYIFVLQRSKCSGGWDSLSYLEDFAYNLIAKPLSQYRNNSGEVDYITHGGEISTESLILFIYYN